MFRKAYLALLVSLFGTFAFAASIPYLTPPWDPTNGQGSINNLIGSLNSNITPGSMAPLASGRNFLDNGSMIINQRVGTASGIATCATTGGVVSASYEADRWGCDVNMVTGAGRQTVATSTPTPPPGFTNETKLYRLSGTLDAPICDWQEVTTNRAKQLAGQTVILSPYAEALGALVADNGGTFFPVLITGTAAAGTDGLGGLRGAVGMTTTVKNSSFTISTTTGLITNASTVVAGQPITITAAAMPAGINTGQVYYVSSSLLNSGTAFAIADTYAHAIAGTNTVIPSTGGTTDVLNLSVITPVWTGLAVYGANNSGAGQTSAQQAYGQVFSNAFQLSATSFNRFSTGPINIPTGITEAAVGICFAPSSNGTAGTTDGIAFTGVQLEIVGPNQTTPSPYEFKNIAQERADAYGFYFFMPDSTADQPQGPVGTLLTTTTCEMTFKLPQPMDVVPIFGAVGTITTTTFHIDVAADTSTLTAAGITNPYYAPDNQTVDFTATLTTSSTAGWACLLSGQTASTAVGLSWSADF